MTAYLTPIAVIIGFIAWAFIQWKMGLKMANKEATENWKEAYEATNTRLKQVEEKLAIVETKYKALEVENKGLNREVNLLKQVKPSELFEETVTKLLDEMKQSREDFLQHASQDAEAFSNMWERIDRTNDIAIENHTMLKKLCKEG